MLAQGAAELAQRKNGNKAHQEEDGDDCEKLDHGEAGICRFMFAIFRFLREKWGHEMLLRG